MPALESNDETPVPPGRPSIKNASVAAPMGKSTRKEPAKHPTPALILRICRNAKPATQPDCVTSDEDEEEEEAQEGAAAADDSEDSDAANTL